MINTILLLGILITLIIAVIKIYKIERRFRKPVYKYVKDDGVLNDPFIVKNVHTRKQESPMDPVSIPISIPNNVRPLERKPTRQE